MKNCKMTELIQIPVWYLVLIVLCFTGSGFLVGYGVRGG